MISTGCRDVQHTGLQSTQSRRNYRATTLVSKVHKQGASSNSQGVQHNYRLAKNTKKKERKKERKKKEKEDDETGFSPLLGLSLKQSF